MNNPFGYSETIWAAAFEEAHDVLVSIAKRQSTIPYSDLVSKIHSIPFDSFDEELDHLLGQISESEHTAGRGMLTVIVAHKDGDQRLGSGFYIWAEHRGYNVGDRDIF